MQICLNNKYNSIKFFLQCKDEIERTSQIISLSRNATMHRIHTEFLAFLLPSIESPMYMIQEPI